MGEDLVPDAGAWDPKTQRADTSRLLWSHLRLHHRYPPCSGVWAPRPMSWHLGFCFHIEEVLASPAFLRLAQRALGALCPQGPLPSLIAHPLNPDSPST